MQLDLSRVSLSRQIAREQHWIFRLLMVVPVVFFLGCGLFFGCAIAYVLGKFLNSIAETGQQARFTCAVSALLWLGGANLFAFHCHWCFFESIELPQFLTMPLTTRQIFRRSLPGVVKTTALSLPLIAILWVPLICGYDGWHSPHFREIPLLVVLQGLLILTLPPFIAMSVYHLHQRVTRTVVVAGLIAAGAVAFQIGNLHDQPGALAWCDALLRNPVVHTFISLCPGTWIAQLFLTLTQPDASFALWAGLVVAGSAVAALAVAYQVSHGYTEDLILAEQERGWSIVEPRRPDGKPRGRTTLLRSPFSFLDPLYERLFTSHQRAIISLVFQDTFEGELGKRAGQVALICVSILFLVEVVQLILPYSSTHATGNETPSILLMILIYWGISFCISPWFPGYRQHRAYAGLRRGSLQVPLPEIVPWEPREYFGTCFRFLSLLALVTWACLLPAAVAVVLGTHDLDYIALAAGLLGLFLELAFLMPILVSSEVQRDPSRTVEGEVRSYLIMVLIAIVCVAAAGGAFGGISMLLKRLGMLEDVAVVLSVVLVLGVADILVYPGWLYSYRRRNFDVDPRDPSATVPSWMMRR